jgi:hypothetical protein
VFDSSRSNRSNLILFGRTFLKAINKLRRQKANCSANLDILENCTAPSHTCDCSWSHGRQTTTDRTCPKANQRLQEQRSKIRTTWDPFPKKAGAYKASHRICVGICVGRRGWHFHETPVHETPSPKREADIVGISSDLSAALFLAQGCQPVHTGGPQSWNDRGGECNRG